MEACRRSTRRCPSAGRRSPTTSTPCCSPRTALPSLELLDRLHEVEAAFDRVRVVRWGPRTLDIDIITVAGERSDDPELTLPHPQGARAGVRARPLA